MKNSLTNLHAQASLRRLAKDHASLQSALPPNYFFPIADDGSSHSDDLTQLVVFITGAEGTPYSSGLWRLHLKIPTDYPKNPPKATFKTRIYHPNVDEKTGAVCLETLKRDWDPKLTLKDILVTISCLLIQPNPDSALNAAAGALIQEDYDSFSRQAQLMTSIHAPIPKSLLRAAQEARRRGEEVEKGSESRAAALVEQHEDDTKENDFVSNDSSKYPHTNPQSLARGKRPLSEQLVPEGDSATLEAILCEPKKKSPKTNRAGRLEDNNTMQSGSSGDGLCKDQHQSAIDRQPHVPSSFFASRPTPIRKGSSNSSLRRGQPRVGIRRL